MYEVETGIPVPAKGLQGKPEKYPFSKLNVGQSFFVPVDGDRIKAVHNLGHAAYVAAKRAVRVGGDEKKFIARIVEEDGKSGVRIWRTK